ncbi:MAG: zinc-finger domain-containing protein [Chitinophagaceae bacterium]|nr:zinc-finger domain-containing protein [Chitinophagaceae bacterium]
MTFYCLECTLQKSFRKSQGTTS